MVQTGIQAKTLQNLESLQVIVENVRYQQIFSNPLIRKLMKVGQNNAEFLQKAHNL